MRRARIAVGMAALVLGACGETLPVAKAPEKCPVQSILPDEG